MNHDHATIQHDMHDKHAGHSPNMFKQKFWLSLFLTFPALIFSSTVQSWVGINIAFSGSEFIPVVFGVIVFLYGGMVFLKSAMAELKNRQPGMMTLISMAITVAFVYSLAVTIRIVEGMDFWWELTTLVTIMLLGHWLEMASVMNAEGSLQELAKLLPDEAELAVGDEIRKIKVSELKVRDMVLVRPGGQIPVDGTVLKGDSNANESMITGESHSVKKTKGSEVVAGTINGSGSLTIMVSKIGGDTALAGIMRLVAEAQKSKSKTQILADKAAFYLTIIAIGAAIITLIYWMGVGASAAFILERIVTVLVIACPHALGLAIPLVTAISTTLAAKNGLLIKKRLALEAARNVDIVLFDKTGTLTRGELGVIGIITDDDDKTILALAAAVERESEHSIARAIVDYAKEQKVKVVGSSEFIALAGRGMQAKLEGKKVYVGGPGLVEELQLTIPDDMLKTAQGKTIVYVISDTTVRGAIVLGDVIRSESKEAIESLRQMNKRIAMVTGDNQEVAAWVAKELNIETYFAGVLPEHKAKTVQNLQKDGSKVAFVGDGVNDAPALTAADVGIAIGAGTDVAIESAGIVLVSSDPRGVAKIMNLSKVTYRKMLQNLVWATGYNIVTIPLAAGVGYSVGIIVSPAMGAVLMSLSTIIVAVNAQFLRKLKL